MAVVNMEDVCGHTVDLSKEDARIVAAALMRAQTQLGTTDAQRAENQAVLSRLLPSLHQAEASDRWAYCLATSAASEDAYEKRLWRLAADQMQHTTYEAVLQYYHIIAARSDLFNEPERKAATKVRQTLLVAFPIAE